MTASVEDQPRVRLVVLARCDVVPRKPSRRQVTRLIRRVPGYRYARRSVLPRLRADPRARSLVKRVFDLEVGHGSAFDVAPGNLLGGVGMERLPVVVVILLGFPANRVKLVVDEIAATQVLNAGFRPVIVMDVLELGTVRRYGYAAELLVPEDAWTATEQSWESYVRDRLTSVITTFRSTATISVSPGGLNLADRRILASLRPANALSEGGGPATVSD